MLNSVALDLAADHIQKHGWWSATDGVVYGDNPKCAHNAIALVAGQSSPAKEALYRYLGGDHLGVIFDWNDAPERTASEVIEVLRACALIEQAKENSTVELPVTA